MGNRDTHTPAQDSSLDLTMTAQDAATALGISGAHLNALLERERIPHVKTTGGGWRLPSSAVFDYKHRRDAARATMREAMQADEQLADEN